MEVDQAADGGAACDDGGPPLPLAELPDELLLRVLAGAGCRAVLASAASCRRLRSLARVLRQHTIFSAAAAVGATATEAIAEATEAALGGMLGCVDFALVFAVSPDKARDGGAGGGGLSGAVLRELRKLLPPGTPVVGCAVAGLMGAGHGGPFEVDPSEAAPARGRGHAAAAPRGRAAAAVLLGRMPACRVRAFANLPPVPMAPAPCGRAAAGVGARADAPPPATAAANAAVCAWLTDAGATPGATAHADTAATATAPPPAAADATCSSAAASAATAAAAAAAAGARSLGLQSVWVMMAGSNAAFGLLDGPGGLLKWMQEDDEARPVIAGGVASGRGDLFFCPGRQLPPGQPEWPHAARGLQYVGLAVMAQGGCHGSGGGGGADGGGEAARGLEPVAPMPPPLEAGAAAAEGGGAEAAAPPAASVRACALALRGCGGMPGQPVFERVAVAREPLRRTRGGAGGGVAGAGGGQAADDEGDEEDEEEEDDDDETGELVVLSGGVSASGRSLVDELHALLAKNHELPSAVVWLAERGDPSLHTGISPAVFTSGRVVMGSLQRNLLAVYGITAFRSDAAAALDAIAAAASAGGGGVLCCQLADITPEGCRQHMRAELPVLRSVCAPYPLLPSGRPDPRSWEGYRVVSRCARAAGARAGPVAMAVFSCTGRGRAIFGDASTECEARIADEVLQQSVPFVGAYCNGELGPFVRHGYAGWFFSPLCVQPPDAGEASGAPARRDLVRGAGGGAAAAGSGAAQGGGSARGGVRGGGVHTVVAGGRVLPLDRTRMQGYTSVFAALG